MSTFSLQPNRLMTFKRYSVIVTSGACSKSKGVFETMAKVKHEGGWFTSDAVGLDVVDVVLNYPTQQGDNFVVVRLLLLLRFHFLLVKQEYYIF
ncbi:MAG: hypothetical protein ACMG6E_07755 [Candidatus Roizmanbacteria bacterium]